MTDGMEFARAVVCVVGSCFLENKIRAGRTQPAIFRDAPAMPCQLILW